ncbi:Pyridoxamine 5'-phosphate oxidase [secondary endosymbiont of Heteropsylla cubana]|uniref:Pyridoxine/pyridoxamine 5'-phosphate oxidase n=1 Tax=secondary endosymbiont of Heteropsylla cubana TaxID=134287 RepID=J3Z5A4_9ENTR|nr:pyridoxamine 5'-phosphate oxidase [secondary endosymbiont of Heteropsylla cubana]AFP85499.1 Pyridoxamine 5'-phosphate oxidase [secondary endosymbiont of Heteropsylla cubana]
MTEKLTDIANLHKEYTRSGLRRSDLTTEPMDLFEKWLKQARTAEIPDATAMNVSTVDKNGQPYQRLVLLKYFDQNEMVFFTNLNSRKATHLQNNPRISLHFSWNSLERQILVLGQVKPLSFFKVMKYFHSRPRESQIGAWVSQQSSRIPTRNVLENKFLELKQKFKNGYIPLPSFWGGYRVKVEAMEFWQGRAYRLHDRFLYQRTIDSWQLDRLAP